MLGTIIIGALLVVAGVLLATLLRNKLSSRAVDVQYMKTTPLADLKQSFDEMSATGLGDNLRQYVEMQGAAAAAKPPQTPYSQAEVAYYEAELVQVYEATEEYTDSDNRRQTRTVRREETVSNEKSTEPLLLKDAATGETVTLDLQDGGMKLDLMPGCDRFEPADNMGSFGFFNSFSPRMLGNRTLGYRMKEKVIPVGQPLYVLGEAYKRAGAIVVGRPADHKKSFIVSTKSEKQIASEAKTGATLALVFGAIVSVAGVAVAVLGIFSK